MLYELKYWFLLLFLGVIVFSGNMPIDQEVFVEKTLFGKVIFVDPGHDCIGNSK